jgi:hypothetical protein
MLTGGALIATLGVSSARPKAQFVAFPKTGMGVFSAWEEGISKRN